MRRFRMIPSRFRGPARWCFACAAGLGVSYAALAFLASHLSPGPDTVQAASFPGIGLRSGTSTSEETGGYPEDAGYAVVRGVLSVHTGRSHDAHGTLGEVAAAARNTGLDFVVLGDHPGEWSRPGAGAMAPHRMEGVLVVPGLELAISGVGRILVVGLDTVPDRRTASVEDLTRRADSLRGFVSVVHPRSPRAGERWMGLQAPGVHAWESFDVSEMVRIRMREPWAAYHLASFLAELVVGRGEGSLAALWRERTGTPALLSYDSVRALRPLSLTGGLNHHPKARLGGLLWPRYEPFFRTVVNHVFVSGEPAEDPGEAQAQLLSALRAGRLFVSLGDAERVEGFRVHGRAATGQLVQMGGRMAWREGSRLEIRMPRMAQGKLLVRILRDGSEEVWLEAERAQSVSWPVRGPGVYRVEVFRGGMRLGQARAGFRPWILSNPVEFYQGDPDRLALHP